VRIIRGKHTFQLYQLLGERYAERNDLTDGLGVPLEDFWGQVVEDEDL